MQYFLIIILIGSTLGTYYYYDKKLAITKKQLMITSNQYRTMRSQYVNTLSKNQNINVKFSVPEGSKALTNTKANIFLAPLTDSPVLKTLTIKMEVKLLDSALINSSTWFYVDLPIDTNINCRGWINKEDISLIYSNSNDLIKTS